MNRRYQELFREEFEKELSKKTGWGRIEILAACFVVLSSGSNFDKASNMAAMRLLDESEVKK